MRYVLVSARPLDGSEVEMVVMREPGRIAQFFGRRPTLATYRGGCTVWHRFPSGARASTRMEFVLCALWLQWKWQAHITEAPQMARRMEQWAEQDAAVAATH